MNRKTMAIALLAGLCVSASAAQAQQTRPATAIERAGMGIDDPDAIVLVRDMMAATSVADDRADNAERPAATTRYLTRIGTAFHGRNSDFRHYGEPPSLSCTAGTTEHFASATLDLPQAAEIQYLDAFGYDNAASDNLTIYLLSFCQATLDEGQPVYTSLGSVATAATPGNTLTTLNLSATPVVVDRGSCRYIARVRMSEPGNACVGGLVILDKVRVQYQN